MRRRAHAGTDQGPGDDVTGVVHAGVDPRVGDHGGREPQHGVQLGDARADGRGERERRGGVAGRPRVRPGHPDPVRADRPLERRADPLRGTRLTTMLTVAEVTAMAASPQRGPARPAPRDRQRRGDADPEDGVVGRAGDAGQREVDLRRGRRLDGGVHRAVEVEELVAGSRAAAGARSPSRPAPREGREAQQLGPAPRRAPAAAPRAVARHPHPQRPGADGAPHRGRQQHGLAVDADRDLRGVGVDDDLAVPSARSARCRVRAAQQPDGLAGAVDRSPRPRRARPRSSRARRPEPGEVARPVGVVADQHRLRVVDGRRRPTSRAQLRPRVRRVSRSGSIVERGAGLVVAVAPGSARSRRRRRRRRC